jgi:phage-related protein
MASFPKLRTEVVTQYSSKREIEQSTQVTRFLDGSEQRFQNMRHPSTRWLLHLHEISEQEMAAIEDFYQSNQGAAASFVFIDPWDGKEHPDCSFEAESLELNMRDHGRCTATIIVRSNQV